MDASGFGTLAGYFTDPPLISYDPRGAGRNPSDTTDVTPEQHAADIHRVIEAVDAGPVDVFASSGGAVNIFALVAAHPVDVRRVVAHEPPTAMLLPDREAALAACVDYEATYLRAGSGPATAKFITLVMVEGELPADYTEQPALGDRLIVGVGVESGAEMAARGGRSVAELVGRPVTDFPSLLGGEFGQQGEPEAFAATLRRVLD